MAEGNGKAVEAVGKALTAFLLTWGLTALGNSPLLHIVPRLQAGDSVALANWKPEPDVTLPHLQLWSAQGFNQRYLGSLTKFDALVQLMAGVNQLPVLAQPITLQFLDCEDFSIRYNAQRKELSLCYDLLAYLEDSFDDLSASPRERELAVLDAVYFLVVRQLSQVILQEAGIPLTARSHDELTVVLPLLLKSRSPGIILSGTQWIFNQGHPLGVSDALAKFQGEPLTLETYARLICTAYYADPEPHPYLIYEVPQTEALVSCRETAADLTQPADLSTPADLLEQWSQRLNLAST